MSREGRQMSKKKWDVLDIGIRFLVIFILINIAAQVIHHYLYR